MSANSNIEWTDHTFNPWIGCTKVSPACDYCYAEVSTPSRTLGVDWGAGQPRRRTSPVNWTLPLRWNAQAEAFAAQHGRRQRVFCASLADVFDNEVHTQWRLDLLDLIRRTPNLDWLLLTKRIGNVRRLLEECLALAQEQMSRMQCENDLATWLAAWVDGEPPVNVWLGATITSQAEADRDIPKLLAKPARVRFLSMEPLLGAVNLNYTRQRIQAQRSQIARAINGETWIDWVIVGGESGHKARPMHPDWARSLRDQCAAAGVPFLFKQWGEWCPRGPESLGYASVEGVPSFRMTDADHNGQNLAAKGGSDVWMNRAGKRAAGRLLDGREWNEFPT